MSIFGNCGDVEIAISQPPTRLTYLLLAKTPAQSGRNEGGGREREIER